MNNAGIPSDHPLHRYREAYLRMARDAGYRPQALSDDPAQITQEASDYAVAFLHEEAGLRFFIECSDYRTNRAFMWVIEAARLLAGGVDGDAAAVNLLEMAIAEVRRS